jgi:hypothetical protein
MGTNNSASLKRETAGLLQNTVTYACNLHGDIPHKTIIFSLLIQWKSYYHFTSLVRTKLNILYRDKNIYPYIRQLLLAIRLYMWILHCHDLTFWRHTSHGISFTSHATDVLLCPDKFSLFCGPLSESDDLQGSSSIIRGWYVRAKRGQHTKWNQSHPHPKKKWGRGGDRWIRKGSIL